MTIKQLNSNSGKYSCLPSRQNKCWRFTSLKTTDILQLNTTCSALISMVWQCWLKIKFRDKNHLVRGREWSHYGLPGSAATNTQQSHSHNMSWRLLDSHDMKVSPYTHVIWTWYNTLLLHICNVQLDCCLTKADITLVRTLSVISTCLLCVL